MQLFESPGTRSSRCRWVLQELGIPFEGIQVNLTQGEHQRTEFLKLNPFGRVPVLVDGDLVLSESIAICLYLADAFVDRGLAPPPGTTQRALHDQWLLFCATELDQPLWQIRRHTALYPTERRSREEVALSRTNFQRAAAVLNDVAKDRIYLAGKDFNVVDIVVTQTLLWASEYGLLADFPDLETYLRRHKARDSCPEELRT